jgi:hypothetical protein
MEAHIGILSIESTLLLADVYEKVDILPETPGISRETTSL